MVTTLFPGGIVTREQQQALEVLGADLDMAIKQAKVAGVPQGLIVAMLHAADFTETRIMIDGT